MQYKPTASLYLERKKAKTDGRYPVKITIYCNPIKKRYGTGIDLTEQEWEKINAPRLKDDKLKEAKIKLEAVKARAEKILDSLTPFSFGTFEQAFFPSAKSSNQSDSPEYAGLEHWFKTVIESATAEDRVGTAMSYQETYNSLNNFRKNLTLHDITPKFLKEYESWMLGRGRATATIGIYLRTLRAVINLGIKAKIVAHDNYPFGKGRFEIPSGKNTKKALSDVQIKQLLNYQPKTEQHSEALDYWLFCFLSSGINMTDVCLLKPHNISNEGFMSFVRAKTKNTKKKDLRPIRVPLHERAKKIIQARKAETGIYLFPVLDPGLSALQIKNRIKDFNKRINGTMSIIGAELKIEGTLGNLAARHSFGTRLKRGGADIQMIKEAYGHSSVLVTENYLDVYDDDAKRGITNMLTQF